jgi:hypothetical protein
MKERRAATRNTTSSASKPANAANAPREQPAGGSDSGKRGVDDRMLHDMVATAAYYLSEHRGFVPGAELDDWLQAEAQVKASIVDGAGSSAR